MKHSLDLEDAKKFLSNDYLPLEKFLQDTVNIDQFIHTARTDSEYKEQVTKDLYRGASMISVNGQSLSLDETFKQQGFLSSDFLSSDQASAKIDQLKATFKEEVRKAVGDDVRDFDNSFELLYAGIHQGSFIPSVQSACTALFMQNNYIPDGSSDEKSLETFLDISVDKDKNLCASYHVHINKAKNIVTGDLDDLQFKISGRYNLNSSNFKVEKVDIDTGKAGNYMEIFKDKHKDNFIQRILQAIVKTLSKVFRIQSKHDQVMPGSCAHGPNAVMPTPPPVKQGKAS